MILNWTLILSLLFAAGLPMPGRPRTKRLSRGPAWTDGLSKLAVTPQALSEADQERMRRRRVAVVGGTGEEGDSFESARVAAELIRGGLRYSEQLIVVDEFTAQSLFDSANDREQQLDIARRNDIDLVVVVRVGGTPPQLSVQVVTGSGQTAPDVAAIELADRKEAVLVAAVHARRTLVDAIDATPSENLEQLDRKPDASFAAIKTLLDAKRTLRNAWEAESENQRAAIFAKAVQGADAALEDSPAFLEAYLLKASCQDELAAKADVKATLKAGFQKMSNQRHDLLTRLELRGDYERFVRSDNANALEVYLELLDAEATSLTGLWALVDILLTGNGATPVPDQDIQDASEIAAQLIVFHPQSGIAQQVLPKRSR